MVEKTIDILHRDRLQWFAFRQTAIDVVSLSENFGIKPSELVFIGGFAFYLQLRAAFGSRVTMGWRGTHDVDLLVFGPGNLRKVITAIGESNLYEDATASMSHLPDKHKYEGILGRGRGCLTLRQRSFKFDLYGENRNGTIELDGRIFSAQKLIYDHPELITLENGVQFGIPSPRDLITLKLNLLNARDSLWPTEYVDIAGCLAVAEKRGIPLTQIMDDVYAKLAKGNQQQRANSCFDKLCKFCWAKCRTSELIVPSCDYLYGFNEWVKNLGKRK